MRGYVVKKGKNYYAVVYDGIDPGTAKEKRKWVSAGPRRSDAEKLVTDLVKRRNKGESVTAEKLSLGTYLTERWLPIQSQLRKSTFDSTWPRASSRTLPRPAGRRAEIRRLASSDTSCGVGPASWRTTVVAGPAPQPGYVAGCTSRGRSASCLTAVSSRRTARA